MSTNENTARRYRDRAKELRAIASALDDAEHRASILMAAEEYEQMAERLEADGSGRYSP